MREFERPSPNSARATVTYERSLSEVLSAVGRAIERLPRWSMVAATETERLHAVRETRLLRFKDDVTIRVLPDNGGARMELESASRIGKGDLGQNPRNLQELLDAVDREL